MLTHRQTVASLCLTAVPQQVRPGDVVVGVLPLFHIFGMQVSMSLTLRAGGTLVTMPRFSLDTFLGVLDAYRVTRAELVAPIVLALAEHPAVDDYDLSSLRVITCGAAPLGAELARACADRLGCRVKQGFGMTELCGASHVAPDTGRDDPVGVRGSVQQLRPEVLVLAVVVRVHHRHPQADVVGDGTGPFGVARVNPGDQAGHKAEFPAQPAVHRDHVTRVRHALNALAHAFSGCVV
jgi:acyl-CoA synthetase (AMP-forming)/AMP-acid ligase II